MCCVVVLLWCCVVSMACSCVAGMLSCCFVVLVRAFCCACECTLLLVLL